MQVKDAWSLHFQFRASPLTSSVTARGLGLHLKMGWVILPLKASCEDGRQWYSFLMLSCVRESCAFGFFFSPPKPGNSLFLGWTFTLEDVYWSLFFPFWCCFFSYSVMIFQVLYKVRVNADAFNVYVQRGWWGKITFSNYVCVNLLLLYISYKR